MLKKVRVGLYPVSKVDRYIEYSLTGANHRILWNSGIYYNMISLTDGGMRNNA